MLSHLKRVFEDMREGLRSHTRRRAEREMIDLNKDPVEDEGSTCKSPPSSVYFSAEEKVDSGLDVDVTSDAVGDGGKETRGKSGEILKGDGGEISEGFEVKAGFTLPLTNAEGLSEPRPLEADRDAATIGVLDIDASSGVQIKGETSGKGRRGRKRKMVASGLSNAGGLGGGSVKEEESGKVARAEEDGRKDETSEHGQDADMGGNVAVVPVGNTDEGRKESSKGRRGRKRKVLESSGGNKDSGDANMEAKRLALDGTPQIVGRVLRSRTREANAGEKGACNEEKGLGDRKSDMDSDRSGKVGIEIQANVQPTGGATENLKRRPGRPPKMHGKNGSFKVTVGQKVKLGSQKNLGLPRAKVVKGSNLVKLRNKKVASAFLKGLTGKNTEKKEGDMRPKEEKRLLKDQIIGILKEAGWTIEYRPRNGRDYLDAVYVDGHGRTHWSVTLAYKRLKQKVEDGTADAKEISAFTPIPGDKLSKLFRITREGKKSKKGPKPDGSKTGKGGSTKRPDRKSAEENIAVSKTKTNISSEPQQGEKSFRKKLKGDGLEQENSMVSSCMRKPKSKRGGRKPCALSARKSKNELNPVKRTLLSWMIDLGTISPGGKVQYMTHDEADVIFEGKITREGICCECCGNIFTLVDFECHAGSMLGLPLQNICLESGQSLLQCMSESWSKQEEIDCIGFNFVNIDGNDPNDDTCNICGDGGDLICCDGCPSTFHKNCLQIQNVPTGDWRCVYCSCKFCGIVCWGTSQKDDIMDPDDSGFYTCLFCEEKFHVNCMLRRDATNINTELFPFCGRGCQKLFEDLQQLLGVKHVLEEEYSWTILRRQDISSSADSSKVENNSKLAIAFSIIDECFTPIIDERSSINLIRSVCYSCGSNFRRLNFSGFFTIVLEKNDELVSAAAIRVHGNQLAEMPFIGTRESYRRTGMCRKLLTAIEMALSSLDVEKLVIPAVSELNETWTNVFGFVPLEEPLKQEMKYMSLVVFPGADLLQKPLFKHQLTQGKTSVAGTKLSEHTIECTKGDTTSTHDTSAATVGSGSQVTDDYLSHEPGIANGLSDFLTSSKDEKSHDFGASEDKLENSKSPEMNPVEKISCATEEGKETLQSQHNTEVYSQ